MAAVDFVDMTVLAREPVTVRPSGSALAVNYRDAVGDVAKKIGVVARVALEPDDDPVAVVNAVRAAARADHIEVKIVELGNTVCFYVNGPQPEEFRRQYALRPPNAPT